MNLITAVSVLVIVAGLSDWLTERVPRVQRGIFYVVFLTIYILYTAKLYYGPDIRFYVPFYESLPSWQTVLYGGRQWQYEWGFVFFCSILKSIGFSFWGMTAVISTLYFVALLHLLEQVEKKRCFALMCIVVLDSTLITVALRQCLAVAFFIFMVLAWQKKRYVVSFACMLCVAACHKSGLIAILFPVLFVLVHNMRVTESWYELLIVVLMLMVLVPMAQLTSPIINRLPLPQELYQSAHHHLQLGRQIQMVAVLYMVVLLLGEHYTRYEHTYWQKVTVVAIAGMAVVVALYQYYYLLNRIRSYFVPFVVVQLLELVQRTDKATAYRVPYNALLRQTAALIVFVYIGFYTWRFERNTAQYSVPLYKASTVLDLRDAEMWQVRNRQMEIAKGYWANDFMKGEANLL